MAPTDVDTDVKNVHNLDIQKTDAAPSTGVTSEPVVGVVEEAGIATMHKQPWGLKSLIVAWFGALLISFTLIYDSQTINAYQPYATSSFGAASLLGTIGTVQNVVQAVMQIPFARLADVYGRFEVFAFSVLVATVGQIMLASSNDINTYAGAQIFFVLGLIGLKLMLQIFSGDTSDLSNRTLMSTIPLIPLIITTWTAPHVSAAIIAGPGWRWGYGVYAILFPLTGIPLLGALFYHQRKAKRNLLNRTKFSIKRQLTILNQLDPVGLILFAAGLSLILVPITISQTATNTWKSPHIIAMLVIGGVCSIAFVIWDIKWAKHPMLAPALMKSYTVNLALIIGVLDYAALYSYVAYFFTFNVVSGKLSTLAASNIAVIDSFMLVWGQLLGGVIIRYFGRYKWMVVAGAGLQVLSFGLLYRYRDASQSLAGMIVALVIYGIGGGMFTTLQTGCQASVSHDDMAAVTGMWWTGLNVGSSVGGAISGALWTNLLPRHLRANLPESAQSQIPAFVGSIVAVKSVPWGTPLRDSINKSYDDTMRILMITALGFQVATFLVTLLLPDFNLKAVDDGRDYGGMVIGRVRANKTKQENTEEEMDNVTNSDGGREIAV